MDLLFDLHRTGGVTLVVVTHNSCDADHCARRIEVTDGVVSEPARMRAHEAAS
jgi:predicted ABC-type transport system involved in lysophospholipase L1 biosynthesis ATPase subunit